MLFFFTFFAVYWKIRLNCRSFLSAALETALEPTYDHAPGAVGDGDVYSARLAFHNNLGSGCSIMVDLDGMPDGVVIPSLNVTGGTFIFLSQSQEMGIIGTTAFVGLQGLRV